MISGGNATIFVSNMDAAIDFYTGALGLKLTNRFGDAWATVEAGRGLTIGLHPASEKYPAPGTNGAMVLGLEIDEPIETVIARLNEKGDSIKGSGITYLTKQALWCKVEAWASSESRAPLSKPSRISLTIR